MVKQLRYKHINHTGLTYQYDGKIINQVICHCKDCSHVYYCNNGEMVIINDDLWLNICDFKTDEICSTCMEKRLGRKILPTDLKNGNIPCNYFFLEKGE